MNTRAEQQMTTRRHRPGEHLFEHRRAERLNVDFERVCVGFTAEPGGCGKSEVVGQTCLVCDDDGVQDQRITVLFQLGRETGPSDIGPLCAACLADFKREQVIDGVRMLDCTHEFTCGACRWCGQRG